MRPLTARLAAACQAATQPRCACRCRGELHGQDHGELLAYERRTGLAYDPECLQLPLPDPAAERPSLGPKGAEP